MASSFTYAALSTAIKNHLVRQGTDFAANIDTLIKLGEDRVVKDLDLEVFDATEAVTLTVDVTTITKPSNTIAGRTVWYTNGSSDRIQLRWRSYEFCQDYWPTPTDTGESKYISDLNETQWLVVPTPNATRTGQARFIKRPTSIITDTAGTWVSLRFGDVLFHACLIASEAYLKADDRMAMWKKEYAETLLPAAKREARSILRKD